MAPSKDAIEVQFESQEKRSDGHGKELRRLWEAVDELRKRLEGRLPVMPTFIVGLLFAAQSAAIGFLTAWLTLK